MTSSEAPPVRPDTASNSPVRIEREGDVGVIVVDNPPVNATSHGVRAGLAAAVSEIEADSDLRAAILIGAGTTFIAGADIREFGKPALDPPLAEVLDAIAACPKPVVAALHGSALGGGFETALACDARIAAETAAVGLPEVKLGLIPGAGGTQRLPRLVGLARAIELVTSGRRVPAPEALALGLVDALVEDGRDLRAAAVEHARKLGRKRRLSEAAVPPENDAATEAAAADALRRGRGRSAVARAVETVRASTLPFAEGMALERRTFQDLRAGEEAAALRHLFFAEREASKIPGLEHARPRPLSRVGVLGAGTMGAGIAVALADAELEVALIERDPAAAGQGARRVQDIYDRQVASGRLSSDEAERRRARIAPGHDFEELGRTDLVVEAVFEDLAVKQGVFRELDRVMRPGAVLASNTSYLDLDRIAGATRRPEDVVGLHFFSPANVMRLLEVVRGARTSDEVLATSLQLAKRLGKIVVLARVGEGFIGNRMFSAYRRQCDYMIEEGALPEEVDAALEAYGFAMGLYAVSDLAGLDIAWKTRQRLSATRDPRERYVAIADRLCEAGRLGQKTGAGWYRYAPGARRGEPDPAVAAIIEAEATRKGVVRRPVGQEEIRRRALAAMINEGALILAEGVAERASDIDVALVHGYGFPAHRGGPMFGADRRGLKTVLAEVEEACRHGGHGWTPAPLLIELARREATFSAWRR